MPDSWFFYFDCGLPCSFPVQPLISYNFGAPLLSRFTAFSGNFLNKLSHFPVTPNVAPGESLNCLSKFASALIVWLSNHSNYITLQNLPEHSHVSDIRNCGASTSVRHSILNIHFNFRTRGMLATPDLFSKISKFVMRQLGSEVEQPIPMLSLAGALVPSLYNISSRSVASIAGPLGNANVKVLGCMEQRPCEVEHRDCDDLSFLDLKWSSRLTAEPRTGIEFPTILDNILAEKANSHKASEVLVGIGSRIMNIIKIKSLKVYAFGVYVHPYSICMKLGPKYASVPVGRLNECKNFYKDLLREDISMTVRLVININGLKFSSVKDAFEKNLRTRLVKINPDTDYECLRTFGSYFQQDIPLHVGTTVDFRRTTDGQLVTEIGGSQIGVVHSKDLCRAFFDMYIGDIPVSEQTKEEVGKNIVSMMKKC